MKGIYGSAYIGANRVAEVKQWEFEETAEEHDSTTMNDAGDKSFDDGAIETGGSMLCLLDTADATGQEAMTVGSTVTLNLYPMIKATSAVYYTGSAKIMSRKVTDDSGGLVELSIGFKINGGITRSVEA